MHIFYRSPYTDHRYFKPQNITGIGTCQDGGLWMNNPTSLVDSEVEVIAPETGEPLVVSVGMGSAKTDRHPEESHSRRLWKNGLVHRMYDALMASMGSKRYWRSGGNYLRFDVDFHGREPQLDDVRRIPAMALRAEKHFDRDIRLDELAYRLIAALFHFELDEMPCRAGSQITSTGYILCDLKHGHPAYRALLNRLSREGARFYLDGRLLAGEIGDRMFINSAGNVCRRVEFTTTREDLLISLKMHNCQPQQISGLPFPINGRVKY
jgi:hypothetical protein